MKYDFDLKRKHLNKYMENNAAKLEMITKEVEVLLQWMETDEYWLKRGGNGPCYDEGGELMNKYFTITDGLNIPRINTLKSKYHKICSSNRMRKNVMNNTTCNKVKVVMLNGYEFQVDIEFSEGVYDIMKAITQHFFTKHMTAFIEKYGDTEDDELMNQEVHQPTLKYSPRVADLVDGGEVLDINTRIIITDETVLTLVLNSLKFRSILGPTEDSSEEEDSESEDYGVQDSEEEDSD